MKYFLFSLTLFACSMSSEPAKSSMAKEVVSAIASADTIVPAVFGADGKIVPVVKTDDEWKKELTDLEYKVLRHEGTEYAFSGDLLKNHEEGTFICRGCHLPLFSSATKFESGTGWPSFWQAVDPKNVKEITDSSYGMTRVEVECARCGGHLGHVFDDGPKPTGLRYCMNSVSLDFVKK